MEKKLSKNEKTSEKEVKSAKSGKNVAKQKKH